MRTTVWRQLRLYQSYTDEPNKLHRVNRCDVKALGWSERVFMYKATNETYILLGDGVDLVNLDMEDLDDYGILCRLLPKVG